MQRIEALTDAQWADVAACRDGLIAEVCRPSVADYARIEAGVKACYSTIGKPDPLIVWVDGPVSVLLAGHALGQIGGQLVGDQIGGQLSDQIGDQLRGQLEDQLWGQLEVQLGGQLQGQLSGQLRGQLGDQLWGQLQGQLSGQLQGQLRGQLEVQLSGQLEVQLSDQLGDQLRDQLEGQLSDQLRDQLRGQLEVQLSDQLEVQLSDQLRGQLQGQLQGVMSAGWSLARFAFWLHVDQLVPNPVTAELRAKAQAWHDANLCHWWLPLDGVAIMSRQHTTIHRNPQGHLHSTTGPAWEWADGTQVWAVEGIRVPPWVVTNPDPARILTDLPNTEQRRVAFGLYGWDRAVKHLGLDPVDTHADPHMGTLYRLPDTLGEATLLICRNASPHLDGSWQTYGLLASVDARTVDEAQASLAGVTVDEWRLLEVAT